MDHAYHFLVNHREEEANDATLQDKHSIGEGIGF
jgi:hypothetical protein